MKQPSGKIIAVLMMLTNLSCTARLDPTDFDTKTISAPVLQNARTVTVKAKLTGAKDRELPVPGGDVVVNEDEFTEVMVKRMIDVLKNNNVSVIPTSDKVIEIQVVKVSLQPDRTMYCVIDFNRKLGGGEFYGFQSRSKNWNFETACEEALNNAVADILADRATVQYLRGE